MSRISSLILRHLGIPWSGAAVEWDLRQGIDERLTHSLSLIVVALVVPMNTKLGTKEWSPQQAIITSKNLTPADKQEYFDVRKVWTIQTRVMFKVER